MQPNPPPVLHNQLGDEERATVINILRQDYVRNVRDLTWTRWLFRKTANITECLGNALLYLGSGLSAISLPVKIFSPEDSEIVLFAGTLCFAAHLTLIGVAKCSSREEGERERQLQELADEVGFRVDPLQPIITDDQTAVAVNITPPVQTTTTGIAHA